METQVALGPEAHTLQFQPVVPSSRPCGLLLSWELLPQPG